MDFFSEKELITQTGHRVDDWPLVIVKELLDNSLDACEEADVPPVIRVTADAAGVTVADNGGGIPEDTLKGVMDFRDRVSSREAYVAPDRGRQGNALKTLLPMPWVVDPRHGRMVVTAHGRRHVITVDVDQVSQRPLLRDDVTNLPKSKKSRPRAGEKASLLSGTEVRLEWSPREKDGLTLWPFKGQAPSDPWLKDHFRALVESYALFNPHLSLTLDWFGRVTTWEATDPGWTKWRPNQPTSALWHERRHLERLIGACVTADRERGQDRLVNDFLRQFDGFSGSLKRAKVLAEAGLKRARLSDLVAGGGFQSEKIALLLVALQRHSRPVNPRRLGLIGSNHFRERFLMMGVTALSFTYEKKLRGGPAKSKKSQPATGEKACLLELPSVVECAFGWLGPKAKDERKIFAGANWSGAISNPFRTFGHTGEGLETLLAGLRVQRREPVVFAVHLAHPRVEFTDRAKSAVVVAGPEEEEE
jgi:hypothetical protein